MKFKPKKVGMLIAGLLLITALYSYAHANAVVIILGDDFFVIPIGITAQAPESISYEYDALGRLVEVDTSNSTQSYDYDAAGNRTVIRIF